MSQRIPISPWFRQVVFPRLKRTPRALNLADAGSSLFHTEPERFQSLELKEFFAWIFSRASLRAELYRPETLERRLPACLRVLKVSSMGEARRRLEADPELISTALSVLLVGTTSFFRDPEVFGALREKVLPALAGSRSRLYIWSAAVSDGAELISLAILLSEMGCLEKSYLLGTDCRADAVARARNGVYDPCALRGLTPEALERHFRSVPQGWRLSEELRASTRWAQEDVSRPLQNGMWDLILFRNTAIYLRSEVVAQLWGRLEAALRPGGFLVLGKAERPLGAKSLTLISPCIYRRTGR